MFSTLKLRIMPILERRVGVKTSGLEANVRGSGFADLSGWGPCSSWVTLDDEHEKTNGTQYIPLIQ